MFGIGNTLTLIATGFSLVAAIMLLLVYLFYIKSLNKNWIAVVSCTVLTLGMCCLQAAHIKFVLENVQAFEMLYYRVSIFVVPSAFFYFSRCILFPDLKLKPLLLFHLFPLSFILFTNYKIVVILSFILGFMYCLWLLSILYRLRGFRKRFKEEFFFFSLFSLMAMTILSTGIVTSISNVNTFYYVYANSIALAYFLVIFLLLAKPSVIDELNDVIRLGYVNSTLLNIDVQQKVAELKDLMQEQKIFQNEDLGLAKLANVMHLSSHQLSELINTQFGQNFSRYIRDQRVEEAKSLLLKEAEVSILSISLQIGFKSQSSFYAAFNEVTGMSPGRYREIHQT